MAASKLVFKLCPSIHDFDAAAWDALTINCGPLVKHAFLSALETSGSVGENTGWLPMHLAGYIDDELVLAMPMYRKTHSYGEYIFDFDWANAYHRSGLDYYPKLVNAIPFSPVTDTRIFIAPELQLTDVWPLCEAFIRQIMKDEHIHSFHSLFLHAEQSKTLTSERIVQRINVQFQWYNKGYTDFDEYLSTMTSRRRKSLKKERQKVEASGFQITRLTGDGITEEAIRFFYACYQQTYAKRSGHGGYLTREFFTELAASMADKLLLVIAEKDNSPVAAAFYVFNHEQLCGRYWGSLTESDGLHFECCYYQGIEFAIEHNIPVFNPGTQGEHKILRGFEPTICYSNHHLAHDGFFDAIKRYVELETAQLRHYHHQACGLLPFKAEQEKG